MIDLTHTEEIYTVSRLNREVRYLLEGSFPALWVEGELSGFKAHTSGHWYFSLKDETAQIRCAMFRLQNRDVPFEPRDGMHVFLKVRVSLYENRGEYQLLAEVMEEAGVGKLQKAFEALKKRLAAAGLFDAAHKKSLPHFPKSIGVVTSPTGAAIKDILSVLKRRYASASVIIYPSLVQGEMAANDIVNAISTADQRQECDVLILARGGGTLEDLWCFNDERVAHAIYQCQLPIVSAIGHEIDFTIADFVADLRAATPTAAAELVTPDQTEWILRLLEQKKQFARLLTQKIHLLKQRVDLARHQLQHQHPERKLKDQSQQLDFYETRLSQCQLKYLADLQTKLQLHAAKIDAFSPLATLKRGFSITTSVKNGTILQASQDISIGEKIRIQLMKGTLECTVDDKS